MPTIYYDVRVPMKCIEPEENILQTQVFISCIFFDVTTLLALVYIIFSNVLESKKDRQTKRYRRGLEKNGKMLIEKIKDVQFIRSALEDNEVDEILKTSVESTMTNVIQTLSEHYSVLNMLLFYDGETPIKKELFLNELMNGIVGRIHNALFLKEDDNKKFLNCRVSFVARDSKDSENNSQDKDDTSDEDDSQNEDDSSDERDPEDSEDSSERDNELFTFDLITTYTEELKLNEHFRKIIRDVDGDCDFDLLTKKLYTCCIHNTTTKESEFGIVFNTEIDFCEFINRKSDLCDIVPLNDNINFGTSSFENDPCTAEYVICKLKNEKDYKIIIDLAKNVKESEELLRNIAGLMNSF